MLFNVFPLYQFLIGISPLQGGEAKKHGMKTKGPET